MTGHSDISRFLPGTKSCRSCGQEIACINSDAPADSASGQPYFTSCVKVTVQFFLEVAGLRAAFVPEARCA